ncbi:MAG: response regulator transcription factor [Arcobacteraceae bacterium]|jgi:DNA-binding response OmpR family regulator|nr:response regulator transcription factor [Arcobacteraceae bacterium]
MTLENLSILYAEDEEVLRDAMKLIIADSVKEFYLAKNGEEAYDIYHEKKPDILLIDINMPFMTGIEVVRKIRETDHTIRVIMITAFSDVENLLNATELKLTKYLVKPFFGHDLFDALHLAANELSNFQVISKKQLILKEKFIWDFSELLLTKDLKEIKLTPKEKKILNVLFSNPNSTISYDNLLLEVWEDFESYSLDTLKTMVKNIRKKLPEDTIQNIYGMGYKYLSI